MSAKQSLNVVCRKFNKNKHSKSGGIKRADVYKMRRRGEPPVKKEKKRRESQMPAGEEATATTNQREPTPIPTTAM